MSIDFDTPGTDDDQPDWLTESLEPEEPDGGDEGGGRLFMILAIGLAGLIILGLFAVGGLLFIRRARTTQVAITPTPTLVAFDPGENEPTATATATQVPPTATNPPPIAATNTRVVQEDPASGGNGNGVPAGAENGGSNGGDNNDANRGGGAGGGDDPPVAATKAPTAVPTVAPSPATEVPNTGFGGFELGLIALGLVGVLLITRRLRHVA